MQGHGQVVKATNKIDVINAGFQFEGMAFKRKEGPNNRVSEMAKVIELKLINNGVQL